MVHGFGRSLVSLAVLALAGGAAAQDTNENFKEAVRLLRMNKDAEARDKLREVLNADPSHEDAFKLVRETDQRIWQLMLEKEGDISRMAQSLMHRARVARKPWSADPEKIAELAGKAVGEDYGERRDATMELASQHGEHGAAALVGALGDSDNDNAQTNAILALQSMGRSAVNPLVAALRSDNDVLRRNAAAALLYVGDERSLADLKRLAEQDDNGAVRDTATKAVQKIGGGNLSAHDLYVKKANDYLAGNMVQLGDLDEVVWVLEDGKVTGTPVPGSVYPMEMAKNAAHSALELNPASEAGFVALTRAYVHQNMAIEDTLASSPDDEAMVATAKNLVESGIVVLGAGPKFLRQAVATDLKLGMIPEAVAGIKLLTLVESPSPEGSPLVAAIDHGDSRVQYAAALALARLDRNGQLASREKVVDILGRAVTEQAVRVVKYIDSDERNRGIAREASTRGSGLIIDASARNGIEGIESLRHFTDVDVVVVNSNLRDITAQDVVRELRENPATASTKVIVVTADKAEDEKTFGDTVAYIEGPITGDALKARIDEVLKGVDLPGPQKRANEISTKAAEALAVLDGTKFDLARISEALVMAAGRDDQVAIPALQALGNGGDAAAVDQVVAIAADGSRSAPARTAAAAAAGAIMARTQSASPKAIEGLVEIAKTESELGLRAASLAAIGRAALAPGERAKVMRDLRAAPVASAAKTEGEPKDETTGEEDEKTSN